MISYIISPVLTFFSKRLYQQVMRSDWQRGFFYLFYLTGLFALFIFFLSQLILLPFVDSLSGWLIRSIPVMTLTSSGLKTDAKQPVVIEYVGFGPICVINTNKNVEDIVREGPWAPILVGQTKILISQSAKTFDKHTSQIIDLGEMMRKLAEEKRSVTISKQVMTEIARKMKSLLFPIGILIFSLVFLVWELLSALFYSVIALILNRFRKEKLRYSNLFSLACYAITPITLIQIVKISIPGVYLTINMFFVPALTICYLAYALFGVPPKSSQTI